MASGFVTTSSVPDLSSSRASRTGKHNVVESEVGPECARVSERLDGSLAHKPPTRHGAPNPREPSP